MNLVKVSAESSSTKGSTSAVRHMHPSDMLSVTNLLSSLPSAASVRMWQAAATAKFSSLEDMILFNDTKHKGRI